MLKLGNGAKWSAMSGAKQVKVSFCPTQTAV